MRNLFLQQFYLKITHHWTPSKVLNLFLGLKSFISIKTEIFITKVEYNYGSSSQLHVFHLSLLFIKTSIYSVCIIQSPITVFLLVFSTYFFIIIINKISYFTSWFKRINDVFTCSIIIIRIFWKKSLYIFAINISQNNATVLVNKWPKFWIIFLFLRI